MVKALHQRPEVFVIAPGAEGTGEIAEGNQFDVDVQGNGGIYLERLIPSVTVIWIGLAASPWHMQYLLLWNNESKKNVFVTVNRV
jgi:hypothetical protein